MTQYVLDLGRLKEALESSALDREFKEVFTFVEAITDQKLRPEMLTEEDIQTWIKKFDKVLDQIFKCSD